jgi:hypothetical protein
MRRFLVFCGLFVMIVSLNFPAYAWEMSLKGDAEWRYRYWTRLGDQDIFGRMDADRVNLGVNHLATFPTLATTTRGSGAFGVLAGENRFGSDMSLNDYRITLYPKFTVNKAIDITAAVNLTSLGIWSDGRPYVSAGGVGGAGTANVGFVNSLFVPIQDRPVADHVPNTYVTLQWAKIAVRTPMLDFSIGYKDSSLGMGLWKSKCNRASSSFGMTAHYGPFKIGFSPYFARELSAWNTGRSRNEGNGAQQRREDRRNYFLAAFGEIEYKNGPLVLQLVSDSYRQPAAPTDNAVRGAAFPTVSASAPSDDILRYRIAAAMKYFNGRSFFNVEADWFNRWRAGRGTGDPATRLVNQNEDDSAWMYGAEGGFLAGPCKVTLNYVRATGDDPSTRFTSEDAAVAEQGVSACYMKDWGYLMYYMYGAGDGWDAAGYGQPTNFHHAGANFSYAVASNLNVSTVLSYAWRDQPTAYRLAGDYQLGLQPWTNEDIRLSQLGTFRGRAVPDHAREIGWEADLVITWKLLENLTLNSTFAYWQPGNWWAFAYPNTANIYRFGGTPNTNPQFTAAGEFAASRGTGRDIDPLMAVETSLSINF